MVVWYNGEKKRNRGLSILTKNSRIKKIALCTLASLIFLAVCGIFIIHNLPVAWDAGVCSGGFETYIFDKFSKDLAEDYFHGQSDIRVSERVWYETYNWSEPFETEQTNGLQTGTAGRKRHDLLYTR